jgi:hypothetical protein
MRQYTKAFIQSLLDKYMEGTTTLEEEDILHQYFTRSDVPAEWEDYRMLFAEIDSMRPTEKHNRRWWPWSMAAAVVAALVVFTITQRAQENQPKSDVTAQVEEKDSVTIPKAVETRPDSTLPKHQKQAPSSTKRRLRKPQPTMTDYDKAYTLMAEAAKEQQQAEQEMDQAQQEILHTQLTAAGYVAIQQEDGTIIYTNEPKEYFAYEE